MERTYQRKTKTDLHCMAEAYLAHIEALDQRFVTVGLRNDSLEELNQLLRFKNESLTSNLRQLQQDYEKLQKLQAKTKEELDLTTNSLEATKESLSKAEDRIGQLNQELSEGSENLAAVMKQQELAFNEIEALKVAHKGSEDDEDKLKKQLELLIQILSKSVSPIRYENVELDAETRSKLVPGKFETVPIKGLNGETGKKRYHSLNGKEHGKVLEKWDDGEIQEYQALRGVKEGPAEVTFPDGRKRYCTFRGNKKEGLGLFVSKTGGLELEQWKEDLLDGLNLGLTGDRSRMYCVEYKQGVKVGETCWFYADGKTGLKVGNSI